jgi:hypothetical protein
MEQEDCGLGMVRGCSVVSHGVDFYLLLLLVDLHNIGLNDFLFYTSQYTAIITMVIVGINL